MVAHPLTHPLPPAQTPLPAPSPRPSLCVCVTRPRLLLSDYRQRTPVRTTQSTPIPRACARTLRARGLLAFLAAVLSSPTRSPVRPSRGDYARSRTSVRTRTRYARAEVSTSDPPNPLPADRTVFDLPHLARANKSRYTVELTDTALGPKLVTSSEQSAERRGSQRGGHGTQVLPLENSTACPTTRDKRVRMSGLQRPVMTRFLPCLPVRIA